MDEFKVGDVVVLKKGMFNHGDPYGYVIKVPRFFRKQFVLVRTDFGVYKAVCTYWVPKASLKRVSE